MRQRRLAPHVLTIGSLVGLMAVWVSPSSLTAQGGPQCQDRPGRVDWDGDAVADVRLHWPICEGIQASAFLLRRTGDTHWEGWYRRLWDHAARYFIDENGAWRNELDEDMRQGTQVWPGRPDVYHCTGALTTPLDV